MLKHTKIHLLRSYYQSCARTAWQYWQTLNGVPIFDCKKKKKKSPSKARSSSVFGCSAPLKLKWYVHVFEQRNRNHNQESRDYYFEKIPLQSATAPTSVAQSAPFRSGTDNRCWQLVAGCVSKGYGHNV